MGAITQSRLWRSTPRLDFGLNVRIFVTGTNGQIARSIREAGASDPALALGFGVRPDFDLARPESIEPALRAFGPDLVINAAAYTAVDRAESEVELAFSVNRDGAGAVALAAERLGAPIIHLSTDYVFDGSKTGPYVETDGVDPQGVYGSSKLAGEVAVAQASSRHLILRTAWVYAPFGANFLLTMIRLSAERDQLRVVSDQLGCPTYAPAIADAILSIARRIGTHGWRDDYAGITHIAGPDAVSWWQFARLIVEGSAARGGPSPEIAAISTAEYPTPARRPTNSTLDTQRLNRLFEVHLPPLATSLANCLDRLMGAPAMYERGQL